MQKINLSRLEILGAAALFSTGGAGIKLCFFTSWQVASFRSAIAALALWFFFPAARRAWSWRTFLVGAVYAATMILYVTANKLTTSANTIFLQSAAPLYLLLLGPWLLKEKIRGKDLAFMAIVALGLGMVFSDFHSEFATAPNPFKGNILAMLSGVSWALTLTGLRWLGRGELNSGDSALPAIVVGNLIAFLVCLPFALPVEGGLAKDWLVVLFLGVFQIGLAYVFMTSAIRHIPALEASILLLVEPAINPIWSWLLHGEIPATLAILGGILILGSTLAKTLWDSKRKDEECVPNIPDATKGEKTEND